MTYHKTPYVFAVLLSSLLFRCHVAESTEADSSAWSKSVQDQIHHREYEISAQTDSKTGTIDYHAPNRIHGFRTRFADDGICVTPRIPDSAPWRWEMTLRSCSDGKNQVSVDSAQLAVLGNRIEYRRGNITEWYVNSAAGLEQGFDIARLSETLTGSELTLQLEIGGTVSPVVSEEGDSVSFKNTDGNTVVAFGKLVSTDANGRNLPSSFAHCGCDLAIRVNTENAVFPITIDPIATSPAGVMDGSQVNELFGFSVNTAGDVNGDGYADVIVGSYGYDGGSGNEGRAFVYPGMSSGISTTAVWSVVGG